MLLTYKYKMLLVTDKFNITKLELRFYNPGLILLVTNYFGGTVVLWWLVVVGSWWWLVVGGGRVGSC